MKIECKCGRLVIDSEANQKYRWMRQDDWNRLLDTLDSEIENITGNETKEGAIMAVRYADRSTPIWQCPQCDRLITVEDSRVLYLSVEDASEAGG